jgi:hypothetical protein
MPMNRALRWLQVNDRGIEWAFVAIFGVLLLHAIADAAGLLGTPGYRPRAMVVASAGMFIGSLAPALGRRVRAMMFVASLVAIALMFGSLRITS